MSLQNELAYLLPIDIPPGFFPLSVIPRQGLDVTLTWKSDLPEYDAYWGAVRQTPETAELFTLTVTRVGPRKLRFQATGANTESLLTGSIWKGYLDVWGKDSGEDPVRLAWTLFDLAPTATSTFA